MKITMDIVGLKLRGYQSLQHDVRGYVLGYFSALHFSSDAQTLLPIGEIMTKQDHLRLYNGIQQPV